MRTIKKFNGKYTEMDTASSSIHEKINFKIQKFRLGKYTPPHHHHLQGFHNCDIPSGHSDKSMKPLKPLGCIKYDEMLMRSTANFNIAQTLDNHLSTSITVFSSRCSCMESNYLRQINVIAIIQANIACSAWRPFLQACEWFC